MDLAVLTVVHRLEVIHKRQYILMSHRHPFKHRNLIPDHVFPPGHEPLIDDLCRIIPSSIDVYALFDNTVRASS